MVYQQALPVLEEKAPPVELFERLDISGINKKISNLNQDITPDEIMKIYHPLENSSLAKQSVKIKKNNLDHQEMEVILIHGYLHNNFIKEIKYVMLLKKNKGKWYVLSIKKNWKCKQGKGHTYWGIETC